MTTQFLPGGVKNDSPNGRTYVIVPADKEPMTVLEMRGDRVTDWQLLEVGDERDPDKNPRIQFLNSLTKNDRILAPLGGVGDAFFVGAYQRGVQDIRRIAYMDQEASRPVVQKVVPPAKMTAGGEKQKERAHRAALLAELVQHGLDDDPDIFRPFVEADVHTSVVRTYLNNFLAVQEDIRKRMELRSIRLVRDQQYLVTGKPTPEREVLDLRLDLVDELMPVNALKEYEKSLEKQMLKSLKKLKIYTDVLEPVRGCGPRIAARIVGTTITIKRFKTWARYRRYAGWDTMEVNGSKVARKFTRGETGGFNDQLRQGVWLMGQQLFKSNSQFRWYADFYMVQHEHMVGQTTVVNSKEYTITRGWLLKKAIRFALSKFLHYIYHGWWTIEGNPGDFDYTNWLDGEMWLAHRASAKGNPRHD